MDSHLQRGPVADSMPEGGRNMEFHSHCVKTPGLIAISIWVEKYVDVDVDIDLN